MMSRLTGAVVGIEHREGVSAKGPWTMDVARVRFADLDFVDVVLNRDDVASGRVYEGQPVDWTIRTEARGGFLSVQRFGDYIDRPDLVSVPAV